MIYINYDQILTDGVADLILLGNPDEIMSLAKEWGLGNIGKATPANCPSASPALIIKHPKYNGSTTSLRASSIVIPNIDFAM